MRTKTFTLCQENYKLAIGDEIWYFSNSLLGQSEHSRVTKFKKQFPKAMVVV